MMQRLVEWEAHAAACLERLTLEQAFPTHGGCGKHHRKCGGEQYDWPSHDGSTHKPWLAGCSAWCLRRQAHVPRAYKALHWEKSSGAAPLQNCACSAPPDRWCGCGRDVRFGSAIRRVAGRGSG